MNQENGFKTIKVRKITAGLIVLSSIMLGGCTTCDVALWMGNDVCEIGGF